MKITPEHREYMAQKITGFCQRNTDNVKAHAERLATDPRVKDTAKRLRWDLLNAAVGSEWVCANLYPYADDTHIDTALRSIVLTNV